MDVLDSLLFQYQLKKCTLEQSNVLNGHLDCKIQGQDNWDH